MALVGLLVATAGGQLLSSGQDHIGGEIVAEPHDGPNGAYAHVDNESGELVVDLTASNGDVDGDGVPAEAFTGVTDVFTLSYTGDEYAQVWLEHDSDHVIFYAGGNSSNVLEGEANSVTLSGEHDAVAVGFVVDSRDGEAMDTLIESVEIHAKVPEDEEAAAASAFPSVDPCPPSPGIDVEAPNKTTRTVSVSDVDPCHTEPIDLLDLEVGNGVTLAELEVAFATSEDVSLEVTRDGGAKAAPFDEPGVAPLGRVAVDGPENATERVEYRFEIGEAWLEREGVDPDAVRVYGLEDGWTERDLERTAEDGTVTYAATDGGVSTYVVAVDAPALTVERAAVDRTTVAPGETITVTATVGNRGAEAPADLALEADREVVDRTSTTVPANGSVDVEFEHAFDEPGRYALEMTADDPRTWSDAADRATVDDVRVLEADGAPAGDPVGDAGEPEPAAEGPDEGADLAGPIVIAGAVGALALGLLAARAVRRRP